MTSSVKEHVLSIVKDIENGYETECCPECGTDTIWAEDEYYKECECGTDVNKTMRGWDYIKDAMDTNYIVNSSNEYLGSRLLVAFGGPNIWIDTHKQTVEGHWWGDSFTASYYRDEMDIDNASEELFGCI